MNDRYWPNFSVTGFARAPFAILRERQVSVPNRSYRDLLYEISLTGNSRPKPDDKGFGVDVVFVLNFTVRLNPLLRAGGRRERQVAYPNRSYIGF